MEFHTKLNTLAQHGLWLIAVIDILDLTALHETFVVVYHCVDYSVTDCFCNDLLCFFYGV
jgi:hypothetical protein